MMREEMIEAYRSWVFRMSAYQMAIALIDIDRATVAPSDGAAYRDEREAYLAGELYSSCCGNGIGKSASPIFLPE